MKKRKDKRKDTPQRLSYVETPLLTGQLPAFGIENADQLPPAERQQQESGED